MGKLGAIGGGVQIADGPTGQESKYKLEPGRAKGSGWLRLREGGMTTVPDQTPALVWYLTHQQKLKIQPSLLGLRLSSMNRGWDPDYSSARSTFELTP